MHAERKKIEALLKTARGQIDGILKMVEDDRYCIDICNQLMATTSVLKKVNLEIMDAHIRGCVKAAFNQDNSEEKLEEIIQLIEKISKNN